MPKSHSSRMFNHSSVPPSPPRASRVIIVRFRPSIASTRRHVHRPRHTQDKIFIHNSHRVGTAVVSRPSALARAFSHDYAFGGIITPLVGGGESRLDVGALRRKICPGRNLVDCKARIGISASHGALKLTSDKGTGRLDSRRCPTYTNP